MTDLTARVRALDDEQRARLADVLSSAGRPDREVFTAFLTLNETSVEVDDLRAYLEARLPPAVIPRRFVVVEHMPRTNAGKLDRRAAPVLEGRPLEAPGREPDARRAPTSTEAVLITVWAEVLGVDSDQIAVDDDFFEIGGDSLLSIRVISKATRAGVRVTPEWFFEKPTIAALAARADAANEVPDSAEPDVRPDGLAEITPSTVFGTPLVRIRSGADRPALVGVPGIFGNLWIFPDLARAMREGRPFYGLQSRGLDGEDRPLETIEEIAEDFLDSLAPIADEGVHLFGICWGSAVAAELAVRLAARGTPARSVALLNPGTLLRADPGATPDARLLLLRDRLELYWDEFKSGDWRHRGRLLVDKARAAARAMSEGVHTSVEMELHQHRVVSANRRAIERYEPPAVSIDRARLLLTPWPTREGEADHRLEWLDLFDPRPDVVSVPGIDAGDAVLHNTAELGAALDAWLEEVESRER